MKRPLQRYTWEDCLIEAETLGLLSAGAVNMCLRLSSAINWKPTGGKPAGLYWKNEDAFAKVNTSRATYYRHRARLFELGFFTQERGNLIPQVPDLSQPETFSEDTESPTETIEELAAPQKSQPEIEKSQPETPLSQPETEKSQLDNPFSVDTLSEDTYSEDILSDTAADAPVNQDYFTRELEVETIALPVSTRPIESIAVLPSIPLAELESASARAVPTPVGRPPGVGSAVDVFAEEREMVRRHNLMKTSNTKTNKTKETVEW